MPLSFPMWGGPPVRGPPAGLLGVVEADPIGEERVQGDPRGPGGPPYNFCRIPSLRKTKWHCAPLGSRPATLLPAADQISRLIHHKTPAWRNQRRRAVVDHQRWPIPRFQGQIGASVYGGADPFSVDPNPAPGFPRPRLAALSPD